MNRLGGHSYTDQATEALEAKWTDSKTIEVRMTPKSKRWIEDGPDELKVPVHRLCFHGYRVRRH